MAGPNSSNIDSSGLYVADGTAALANVSTSAAATTPTILGTLSNLARFTSLLIQFKASTALAGGNCSYLLERLMPDGTWDDYLHLGQQSAGVAFEVGVVLPCINHGAINETAAGGLKTFTPHSTFADATIVLSAGSGRIGHFGRSLRVISRTLANVNAAAVTNTYVRAFGEF
jgi:hypothetical protein